MTQDPRLLRPFVLRIGRGERNAIFRSLRTFVEQACLFPVEEVKKLSPHADSYGRPHIALAMVQRGYVKSVAMAFSRYIASGKPCYVEGEK